MKNWNDDFRKVFLAGIGALALTAEKGKEMIDTFVAKGEITLEQGKSLNEELKRNVSETLHKTPCDSAQDDLLRRMEQMQPEELAAIKNKLAEMEKQQDGKGGKDGE